MSKSMLGSGLSHVKQLNALLFFLETLYCVFRWDSLLVNTVES